MNFLLAYLPNPYNFVVCLRLSPLRSPLGFCRRSIMAKGKGNGIISLNAQILLKSFRKEFENSTSRGTREVRENFSFFVPRAESFSLLHLGILICVWLLSTCADNCLYKMRQLKIIFRHRIFSTQQSSIATAYTNPENPINAIARIEAVIKAIGTP